MKKYYKLIIVLLVVLFLAPQVAFASWWNPFSWFGNKNSALTEKEIKVQQEIQDTSDQSAMIEQLNKTIAELEKQIEEYQCPACVGDTTQCPACNPQIITKEVPVEKIVYKECSPSLVQTQIESGISQLNRPHNKIYVFEAYGEDFFIKDLVVSRSKDWNDSKLYSNINAGEDNYISYFSKCVREIPSCYYLCGDNPTGCYYLNIDPKNFPVINQNVKFSLLASQDFTIKKIQFQGVNSGKVITLPQ